MLACGSWRPGATSTQAGGQSAAGATSVVVRVATFNVEDVRTEDLMNPDHPRLRKLAEVIQRIRPNIILLNEIAYDQKGMPGAGTGRAAGDDEGQNGRRFAENFLARAQATDVKPLLMTAFMAPSNTGLFSGFDLDNDGKATSSYPTPEGAKPDGSPGAQNSGGRAYGNDCFGFGTFPGQYGMALLVDSRLTIDADAVRTFQLFPWDYMPANVMPADDASGGKGAWYTAEERAVLRLSSKSHWDVPVKLPGADARGGGVLRVLCSHPTPPAFDGPEQRNKRRNHDEIRFWRDYIDNAPYIVDDKGVVGGIIMAPKPGGLSGKAATKEWGPRLGVETHFVVLGDLNADPKDGDSFQSPIKNLLFRSPHVNSEFVPVSDITVEGLDNSDTSRFKLRVDYVLPSKTVRIVQAGVWRQPPTTDAIVGGGSGGSGGVGRTAGASSAFPSDHYPVWMDIEVPLGGAGGAGGAGETVEK